MLNTTTDDDIRLSKSKSWYWNFNGNYDTIANQLDQLYHDMKDGKLGVAATTGSWYVGITSVKTAFPKPS